MARHACGRCVLACASSSAASTVWPCAERKSSLRPTKSKLPSACSWTRSPVGLTGDDRPACSELPFSNQDGGVKLSPDNTLPSSQSSPTLPIGDSNAEFKGLHTQGITARGYADPCLRFLLALMTPDELSHSKGASLFQDQIWSNSPDGKLDTSLRDLERSLTISEHAASS